MTGTILAEAGPANHWKTIVGSKATSNLSSIIGLDEAILDGGIASISTGDAAAFATRLVVADRAMNQLWVARAEEDAAAVVSREVVEEHAIRHGRAAFTDEDASAVVGGLVSREDALGDRGASVSNIDPGAIT